MDEFSYFKTIDFTIFFTKKIVLVLFFSVF